MFLLKNIINFDEVNSYMNIYKIKITTLYFDFELLRVMWGTLYTKVWYHYIMIVKDKF